MYQNILGIIFTELGISTELLVDVYQCNPSANAPYHSGDHEAWVAIKAYQFACDHNLPRSDTINLVTAAAFHDYDHTMGVHFDYININRAVSGIRYIAENRGHYFAKGTDIDIVENLIQSTEYPYKNSPHSLSAKILRVADLTMPLIENPTKYFLGLKSEMQIQRGYITFNDFASGLSNFYNTADYYGVIDIATINDIKTSVNAIATDFKYIGKIVDN